MVYIKLKQISELTGGKFCTYVLVGTATLVLLASRAKASAPVVKDELLNALQALRQAVRSKVTSGYGVAEEKTTDTQVYARGMRVNYQPERVKFWFSGNECLAKHFSVVRPPSLFQSVLRKHGVLVHFRRYSMGMKLAAPQVTVHPGVLPRGTEGLRPVVWTYKRITEISSSLEPDSQFFIWARKPEATVRKEGGTIIVTFEYPPDPPNFFGEKCVISFDLACGGMVTDVHHIYDEAHPPGHQRIKQINSSRTKWRNFNGCWLPVARTLESRYWVSGKDRGFTRTKIRFVKFVLGPLRSGILSVRKLGIPNGIFVDDTVHKELYHFTEATAGRIFGTANHTPRGHPEGAK